MLTNQETDEFYRSKLSAHGPSAAGMGWKDEAAQVIRFRQLIKILPIRETFSINDLGCGSGDLITLLGAEFRQPYTYFGYDALQEMIDMAHSRFPETPTKKFRKISGYHELEVSDYSVASGIFNVRNSAPDDVWLDYILSTLKAMADHSKKGFAFNALTKYSDTEKMRSDLFYSDPLYLFDFCKRNFSQNVALLHDYGIYDFTILVRKDI
jgi:SAM-dependent methyltransferase